MRVKISRKETKESNLWLKLMESKPEDEKKKERLITEGKEFMKIFGSILEKCK